MRIDYDGSTYHIDINKETQKLTDKLASLYDRKAVALVKHRENTALDGSYLYFGYDHNYKVEIEKCEKELRSIKYELDNIKDAQKIFEVLKRAYEEEKNITITTAEKDNLLYCMKYFSKEKQDIMKEMKEYMEV